MRGTVVFSTGSDAKEGNHTCTFSLVDGDTLNLVIEVLDEVKAFCLGVKLLFECVCLLVTPIKSLSNVFCYILPEFFQNNIHRN